MKKSLVVLLHIGFWMCFLMLILVILAMFFQGDEAMDERIGNAFEIMFVFAILPSFISFYGFYVFLFPHYLKHQKIGWSILYGLSISLFAGMTGFAILYWIDPTCSAEEEEMANIGMTLFMSMIALISGIVSLVIKGFLTWFEELKLKEELQQKNHEMEMALVKSQLDPHFLFNTINNIDILILKDAEQASNYLNQLSDIMRFMLYETKADKIPLVKEIEYIEKYIELQKIRTANAQYVNFQLTGDPANKSIAPMVFIPFMENAFKHTNNKKLENAIAIDIEIDEEMIRFKCVNKFDPNMRTVQDENNGLGNDLIQKRLHLIYPEKHALEVLPEDRQYSVILTIQHA